MLPRSLTVPPGVPDFMTRTRHLEAGPTTLTGRAWTGHGSIDRVEVSTDGGAPSIPRSWTRRLARMPGAAGASSGTRPRASTCSARVRPTARANPAARPRLEPEGLREQRGGEDHRAGRALDCPPRAHLQRHPADGRKHLGNYIGAIRGYLEGQERGDPAIYCIVDLHATSVSYDPKALPGYVLDTTAMLVAAGLDPERCILFRQSDVGEHAELCWLLSAVTPYGDLQRMTQFKDKSAREQELVRTSLFLYPVLQAADILVYKADQVPVGEDQRQHLELAREIARRFNSTYGEVFVEPEAVIPKTGARIMDLQSPDAKMSTTSGTEAGLIYIDDEPEAIVKRSSAPRPTPGAMSSAARTRLASGT